MKRMTFFLLIMSLSFIGCEKEALQKTDFVQRNGLPKSNYDSCKEVSEKAKALTRVESKERVLIKSSDLKTVLQLYGELKTADESIFNQWSDFFSEPRGQQDVLALIVLNGGHCVIKIYELSKILLSSLKKYKYPKSLREKVLNVVKERSTRDLENSPTLLSSLIRLNLVKGLAEVVKNDEVLKKSQAELSRAKRYKMSVMKNWSPSLEKRVNEDGKWTQKELDEFVTLMEKEYRLALELHLRARRLEMLL